MIPCNRSLLIFDLDGVLIDSRDAHFVALNRALESVDPCYVISREDHLSTFDGLPTTKKLELLSQTRGLPRESFDMIWELKQQHTISLLSGLGMNITALNIAVALRKKGWKVAVASNAIRKTILTALEAIGLLPFVDHVVSNEDVRHTKPFPEMYWQCMTTFGISPRRTVIIEDSHIGRQGALDSGAHLYPVENVADLKEDRFMAWLDEFYHDATIKSVPWRDKKLNVLIPMAGAGSRFTAAGFVFPKPLIEVNGKPMIQVVVENLNIEANYIFLVQKEHYEKYNLKYLLNLLAPNATIVQVDGITQGAACTTLLAKEYINNENPLVIANSDQFIKWNSNECMYAFTADGIDGGILTFTSTHPKWSYAALDDHGFVKEVAEKKPISNIATVGVYYWRKGSDYVRYAEQMITKNIRFNNEFYVAPTFNQAIEDGKKIRVKAVEEMWGIGDPQSLSKFLAHHSE